MRELALVLLVAEADAPVRSVAERLVLRAAAAAERIALGRSNRTGGLAAERDAADDRVGAVLRDRDSRRSLLSTRLHVGQRVAQRAGRALADGVDDRLDRSSIGIDPGL